MSRQTTSAPRRAAAALAAGVVASGVLFAGGCGTKPKATPMDDEYAGGQEEYSEPTPTTTHTRPPAGEDTGVYRDGTYAANSQYGPVGEDTIDVSITIEAGTVSDVSIVGHPLTTISRNHQDDFSKAIGGVVIGKPLEGLSVDKVAGASWTSEAFNAALDVIRTEASISAGESTEAASASPSDTASASPSAD